MSRPKNANKMSKIISYTSFRSIICLARQPRVAINHLLTSMESVNAKTGKEYQSLFDIHVIKHNFKKAKGVVTRRIGSSLQYHSPSILFHDNGLEF
jgi:hypothetical protein